MQSNNLRTGQKPDKSSVWECLGCEHNTTPSIHTYLASRFACSLAHSLSFTFRDLLLPSLDKQLLETQRATLHVASHLAPAFHIVTKFSHLIPSVTIVQSASSFWIITAKLRKTSKDLNSCHTIIQPFIRDKSCQMGWILLRSQKV